MGMVFCLSAILSFSQAESVNVLEYQFVANYELDAAKREYVPVAYGTDKTESAILYIHSDSILYINIGSLEEGDKTFKYKIHEEFYRKTDGKEMVTMMLLSEDIYRKPLSLEFNLTNDGLMMFLDYKNGVFNEAYLLVKKE